MSTNMEGRSSVELDRERVTCLLLINTQLMKKAISLHNRFFVNQNNLNQLPPQTKQSIMDSFQNCNRRIHCNLTVLSYIHERYHVDISSSSSTPNKNSFPVIMAPPQDMPELNQLYQKLQELYPEGLQFLKAKLQQMRKQQQNQPQHNQPAPPAQLHNPMHAPQGMVNNQSHIQVSQPGPSPHLGHMGGQRQMSQISQNSMTSPMLGTPTGSHVQSNSLNTAMVKDGNSDFQNQAQSHRQFQGGFNPNLTSSMNLMHQSQGQQRKQPQSMQMNLNKQSQQNGPPRNQQIQQAQLSPQQIFSQMNNNVANNSGNEMLDFFNV